MESINNKKVTVLAVKDLQRSTSFYLSCLGARAQHKEPGLFVQIGINDQTIRLVPKTGGNSTHPENFTVHISVPDIAKMSEYLNLNCVEYNRYGDAHGRERLEVVDPDGYTIVMAP